MKCLYVIAALSLAVPAAAQIGGSSPGLGKSAPPKSTLAPPVKGGTLPPAASNMPAGSAVPQQADLRIVNVEGKIVMQECKVLAPFAEVLATVKNKGSLASAGLNDPSAVAAVFSVDGKDYRYSAAGGLLPLPPGGTQVVVMKIPFHVGLFPTEKLEGDWTGRKTTASYFIQVNAAGLVDESKAGNKGVSHDLALPPGKCPQLFNSIPPTKLFDSFVAFCTQNKAAIIKMCSTSLLAWNAQLPYMTLAEQEKAKKSPHVCGACRMACPTCNIPVGFME